MRFNLLLRFQNWQKDLFKHTQNLLTLQYSAIITIFLALFVTIIYFLVNTIISYEQRGQLLSTTDQQAMIISRALRHQKLSRGEIDNLNSHRESGNQFFYLVINQDGELLSGEASILRLQPQIMEQVKGWIPRPGEIRELTIKLPLLPVSQKSRQIRLMTTGRAFYQGDQLAALLYTGKDISFIFSLMQRLLIILVTIGIIFLGIAMLLSHYMSKRAMIPIRISFRRQQEFVADASHELRTPLSILNSSLDVLEMEEGEQISDYSRNVLFNMKDEVKRMNNLVGDMLTLARSDSGSPELNVDNFDFIPAVEQLVRSTQTLAQSKNITLNLQAPPTAKIHGDNERLKQLLYILLDNAIKYTPSGGEVNLGISFETVKKQNALRIVVQDTGVGISPEEQVRIFDRFYRVDKNRSRQVGGTGLGLAIAKWIVEAHHGTIQVSSKPGKGSTFTVMLPMPI